MARKGAQLFFVDVVNDKMDFTTSVTAIKSLTAKYPKARAKVPVAFLAHIVPAYAGGGFAHQV